MQFCHIVPTKLVPYVANHPRHLVLAHLVEFNDDYVNQYLAIKRGNPNATFILDNSAFELTMAGKPMYPSEKLIDLARKIKADYIVMSDYPRENWKKTQDKAVEMASVIKSAGFKTFYCPQSELGDIDGLCESFKWAIANKDIDLIGVSILAAPIGFGVDPGSYSAKINDVIRLQRTLARVRLMIELERRSIINRYVVPANLFQRFHFLGMQDAISEITLAKPWNHMIASWDSSAAGWNAVNGIEFDNTPTMLVNGKIKSAVDFDWNCDDHTLNDVVAKLTYNVNAIDKLVSELI